MKKILCILLLLPSLVKAQPSIHISATADTICAGTFVNFSSAITGVTSPHFKWEINEVHAGTDYFIFNLDTLRNGDSVMCQLTDSTGDTVFATSNRVIMTVLPLPNAGTIMGPDTIGVCVGAIVTLTDSVVGGVWIAQNGYATVDSGVVTGIESGNEEGPPTTDIIYYIVSNSYCADTAKKMIVVNPLPMAGFFLGTNPWPSPTLCVGQSYWIEGGGDYNGFIYSLNGDAYSDGVYVYCISVGHDVLIDADVNSCGADTFRMNVTIYGPSGPGTIITTSTNICVDDTVMLEDANYVGTPNWLASNQNAKLIFNYLNNDTVSITGASPGLDTIVFDFQNGCGYLTSISTVITVLPPDIIIGIDNFCLNEITTFIDNSPGGTWNSNNTSIATIDQSGVITSVTAGAVVISYTDSGCTVTKQLTVNLPPSPIIGPEYLCAGAHANLNDSDTNGFWSSSNPAAATIDHAGVINGIDAGITTIIYTSSLGCNDTMIVTVNPYPPPISGFNGVCKGFTITLTDSISGGAWNSNNANIATIDSSTGILSGIGDGVAIITYTLPTGCFDTANIYVNTCEHEVVIYPDPANDELMIHAFVDIYNTCTIYNSIGQKVLQQSLTIPFTNIDIRLLAAGMYFIKLVGDGKNYVSRFVKD